MTKLTAKNKKEFEAKIREYRTKGYNLITLGKKTAELENDNEIVVIER